jgi:hypothetical protein
VPYDHPKARAYREDFRDRPSAPVQHKTPPPEALAKGNIREHMKRK